MSSSTPPNGYPAHTLKTIFLRVPFGDWNEVRIGRKREFRTKAGRGTLTSVQTPTPVVAYTVNAAGKRAAKLMVLEFQERQHLIDIANNPISLDAEGFKSYDEFKRYWRARHGGVYRALQPVIVSKVRLWAPGDEVSLGQRLVKRLYGDFLGSTFSEHVAN